ncbi:MAG TPA: hypothetical protein VD835_05885, partial [Pyrinomonadaceae bacterium]|nr:hypothetical protein [Pyrinomonadaceae bacterium]
ELGDAPEGEDEDAMTWYEPPVEEQAAAPPAAAPDPTEVPVFDDMIERNSGEVYAAEEASPANGGAGSGAVEFEWNSVAMPEAEEPKAEEPAAVTIDPNSSFADLNEDSDSLTPRSHGARTTTTFGAADLGVGAFDDSALAPERGTGDGRVKLLLAQELESVDYYLAQGYSDIARDTLDMLERQYGANEEIARRRRQLAPEDNGFEIPSVVAGIDAEAESATEFEAFAQFESFAPVEDTESEDVELSGELFVAPLEEEDYTAATATTVVNAKPAAPPQDTPLPQEKPPQPGLHPDLADMFDEFRDEVEADAPASTEDYETHYNTGIAYREMGLVDQAVEELQAAIALAAPQDGTPRYLQCCNLLGHCFMQKNMPRPAAMWFKKGLDAPGHTEDEYQALRYELGAAYEQMGDLERAIEVFSEVYGTDVNYRGVAAKLRDLQAIRK